MATARVTVERVDASRVRVTKPSPLTGVVHSLEMAMTPEQWEAWCGPGLSQNRAPHLTSAEREFLQTGYTAADWAAMFPPEPEEREE